MGIGIDWQRHQRGNGLLNSLKCTNIFGVQSLDVLSVDTATATMLLGQPTMMEMDCKVEELELDGWMDSWIYREYSNGIINGRVESILLFFFGPRCLVFLFFLSCCKC